MYYIHLKVLELNFFFLIQFIDLILKLIFFSDLNLLKF